MKKIFLNLYKQPWFFKYFGFGSHEVFRCNKPCSFEKHGFAKITVLDLFLLHCSFVYHWDLKKFINTWFLKKDTMMPLYFYVQNMNFPCTIIEKYAMTLNQSDSFHVVGIFLSGGCDTWRAPQNKRQFWLLYYLWIQSGSTNAIINSVL